MTSEPASGSGLHVKAGTAASWGPQYTFDDVSMPTDYGLAGGAGMRLGGYSGGAPQGDAWTREVYRNGELIEAGRWNGSVSTGVVDASPETGTTTYAVRESQIEVREVPPLAAPSAAGRMPDALAQARNDSQAYYRDIQDSAVANSRPDFYIGAKFGSLAADVGYDFAEAGRGVYRLATDAHTRASAAEQLKFLATHPEVLVDGAIDATRTFINKPFDQQAESVFKGGLSLLAGAGGAKLGSAAGGLTLQGVERSAQWLGPTAENMLLNSMDRMGLVLRAMPETTSLDIGKYARRSDVSYRLASDVNATFPDGWSPPYKPGTRVTEFTSTVDDVYVRVHGENNMARSWMMKREAIDGLTPNEIQSKYALPEVPSHMSEVNVPGGTRIRTGIVNPVFGGIGNAIQYELLQRLPVSAFSNTVRLGQ